MTKFGILLVLGVVGCSRSQPDASPHTAETTPPKMVVETPTNYTAVAKQAIARGDLPAADTALRQQIVLNPNDAEAIELSGDVATRLGDNLTAAVLYQSALQLHATPNRSLLNKRVKGLLRSGQPFDAIDTLNESIKHFPDEQQARYDLAGIAAGVGVPQAALPSLRWFIQHGQSDPESLLLLADPQRAEPDIELCKQFLAMAADDLRCEYGIAKLDAMKNEWTSASARISQVLDQHPEFLPAYTLRGRALLELGDLNELVAWQHQAPASAVSSPEYWIVVARLAQSQRNHDQAARAFWEALQLDSSSYPEALPQLLVSLHELKRHDDSTQISKLISKHAALGDSLKIHLERHGESQAACLRVAEALLELGRVWESEAWARLAVSLPNEKVQGLSERYMSIRNQLTVDTPWRSPAMSIENLVDLSELPRPSNVVVLANDASIDQTANGLFRFEDQAHQRGWIHTSIPAPASGGHWVHQSVGGGVGVIDFDCDGWPDLAAAKLDGTALKNDSSPNQLCRNVSGSFVDVSGLANYTDTGFSQGITVGDYNDDGFPDLFDANIGQNRLYRNNGDGTFAEVSVAAGLHSEIWTTSAVLVDIDGDHVTDLYEVAYCAGRAPFEHECRNNNGVGTCAPLTFDAELDRVWRGMGDGTFVELTTQWMRQTSPGRGLGIVAGLFDENPGIDLLVANDMTANHLWSASPSVEGFQLVDLGVIRGLGLSGNSRSQASMGIATGDADSDGDLDFVMTHFADDYNTYYEQVAPGFWNDRSAQVDLATPSMKSLGFGTQFVDIDNNGHLELIVANGHVDQVDRDGVTYRMHPQLFSRQAVGKWSECDRHLLGDYFTTEHLGRALALADLDRDGRTDIVITHLDDPASLLMNRTPDAGRSIGLELKATMTSRDAIGARVSVVNGGQPFTAQLIAGDGYMCTNQRRVVIGTGSLDSLIDVQVLWPSGAVESFGELASGSDYLLVEGSGEAHLAWEHL